MKQILRKEILRRRNALSDRQKETWSDAVVQTLAVCPELLAAKVVFAYMAIGKEVDLSRLFPLLWQKGIRLAVPVCLPDQPGQMKAAELRPEMLDQMATGMMAVPEPPQKQYLDPQEIDLVLVPGVAFDCRGGRIGYGAGYYDRFIPQLKKTTPLWGICYSLQVVENAFVTLQDQSMAGLVTENGFQACSGHCV